MTNHANPFVNAAEKMGRLRDVLQAIHHGDQPYGTMQDHAKYDVFNQVLGEIMETFRLWIRESPEVAGSMGVTTVILDIVQIAESFYGEALKTLELTREQIWRRQGIYANMPSSERSQTLVIYDNIITTTRLNLAMLSGS